MNKYNVGEKVEHILTGDWLLVLDVDQTSNRYFCRTKDLRELWFSEFELRKTRRE